MIAEVIPRSLRYCGLEEGVRIWLIVAVFPLNLDLVGEVLRVVPNSPDEARTATRQPRQPEEIHAGNRCNATLLDRVAALVEDSLDLQPGVVDSEAGRRN